MKAIWLVLASAPLLACAAGPSGSSPVRSISYETGPCYGTCPVYRVTVNSDGSGTFEGIRFTTTTGSRAFRATPAQYRAFSGQLEPIRPASGSVRYAEGACGMRIVTDQPSAEVVWRTANGEQRLYFYFGCDMQRNRALSERLRAAPALLPIGDFIGRR